MYEYLNQFPDVTELIVLVSFYNDVRNGEKSPTAIYRSYLKKYPQYKVAIKIQYEEDKKFGFPELVDLGVDMLSIDHGLNVIDPDVWAELEKEEKEALDEQRNLEDQEGGQLILDIEKRFDYLHRHEASKKLGLNIPLKEW